MKKSLNKYNDVLWALFVKGRLMCVKRVVLCVVAVLVASVSFAADSVLTVPEVKVAQFVNGDTSDPAWKEVKALPIKDQASGLMIWLKAVRKDDMIYFHVLYPDPAENFLHKPWHWDADGNKYLSGKEREDTFVFKWSMEDHDVDLSNFSEDSYTADVWYWKANRTNLAGYADDKRQVLGDKPLKNATETISDSGKKRYLLRKSDQGTPAYTDFKPETYSENFVQRYLPAEPSGSRSDVNAKGVWRGGFWNIEFSRKLETGHDDDIQFHLAKGKRYKFGISIFSLYGRKAEKDGRNFYGLGRISEPIYLAF